MRRFDRAAALREHALPPLPATLQPPEQPFGVRRSRGLPYRPSVELAHLPERGEVTLRMANAGAAAVLHVYDRFDLAAIPRRYTVGNDAIVDGTWTTYDGRYDLWLLGPNGFHRHYRGDLDAAPLLAEITQDPNDCTCVLLSLRHSGNIAVQIELQPGAYTAAQPRERLSLAPDTTVQRRWKAAATGGWYDLWVHHDSAAQHLAGRIETGADSVSDPAMGGPARLQQDMPVSIGALG